MISGASRGIGREIATTLYRDGYTLSLGVRKPEALALDGWDAARVAVHPFDAEDRDTHRAWVDATAERFGRIDGLVNNAGINRPLMTIETYEEDPLDRMWAVNVKGRPCRSPTLRFPTFARAARVASSTSPRSRGSG